MYRKHLREMEQSLGCKTGSKTIDHIADIPVVCSALSNVTDYYGKVKEKNALFRTSLNLAEMSFKTMAFAAAPITTICKKPIESVDSYLYGKLNDLEHTFPTIVKPTDLVKASLLSQAKMLYTKTVKEPIDTLNNIKEKTTDFGYKMVDACLENRYAKVFTDPVLNLTEKSLDYWFPIEQTQQTLKNGTSGAKAQEINLQEAKTLSRLYDINSRLYNLTFKQLNRLHVQFEGTINKLITLKQISELMVQNSKEKLIANIKSNSLAKQCIDLINKNQITYQNLEQLTRQYSKAILNDVSQMLEKYMSLVKNFPLVFNGTKLRQTLADLTQQINKASLSNYLNTTIEQLLNIHHALVSYTQQMFQVVNDSRLMQMLKRISTETKLKKQTFKQNQNNNNNNNNNNINFNKSITNTNTNAINNENLIILNKISNENLSLQTSKTDDTSSNESSSLTLSAQSSPIQHYSSSTDSNLLAIRQTSPAPPPPPTPIIQSTETTSKQNHYLVDNLNKIILNKLNENLNLERPENTSLIDLAQNQQQEQQEHDLNESNQESSEQENNSQVQVEEEEEDDDDATEDSSESSNSDSNSTEVTSSEQQDESEENDDDDDEEEEKEKNSNSSSQETSTLSLN